MLFPSDSEFLEFPSDLVFIGAGPGISEPLRGCPLVLVKKSGGSSGLTLKCSPFMWRKVLTARHAELSGSKIWLLS